MAKKKSLDPVDYNDFGTLVCGVDEVGRGCLAGPVYAAAVVLRPDYRLPGLTDSKLMSAEKRTKIAEVIKNEALYFAIETASVQEIDELNILWASMLAMRRAIEKLSTKPNHVLVDGHQKIPKFSNKFTNPFSIEQSTLVKGDLRCLPISAASVLAKVARDQFMEKLSEEFPVYDFTGHKGYPTSSHQAALREHGPSIWHRRTFKGVKEFYETPSLNIPARSSL